MFLGCNFVTINNSSFTSFDQIRPWMHYWKNVTVQSNQTWLSMQVEETIPIDHLQINSKGVNFKPSVPFENNGKSLFNQLVIAAAVWLVNKSMGLNIFLVIQSFCVSRPLCGKQ
jgi:hypothetical protein